jgi:hypothetical protein
MIHLIEQYRTDFPLDDLLSDKQIEAKISSVLLEMGVDKIRTVLNGEQKRVWKVKKL